MAVMGLVVGMGVPAFGAYAKQARMKATTRQLIGLISLARSSAVGSREEHAVVIDPEQRDVRVVAVASGTALEHVVRLPSTVALSVEQGGEPSEELQFVFRSSGALTGQSVILWLTQGQARQAIQVSAATGAIVVGE